MENPTKGYFRAVRPSFRKRAEYVAVKPIPKLGLEPGDDYKPVRPSRTRWYYDNLILGVKNHPWTKQSIKRTEKGLPLLPYTLCDTKAEADRARGWNFDPRPPAQIERETDETMWRFRPLQVEDGQVVGPMPDRDEHGKVINPDQKDEPLMTPKFDKAGNLECVECAEDPQEDPADQGDAPEDPADGDPQEDPVSMDNLKSEIIAAAEAAGVQFDAGWTKQQILDAIAGGEG